MKRYASGIGHLKNPVNNSIPLLFASPIEIFPKRLVFAAFLLKSNGISFSEILASNFSFSLIFTNHFLRNKFRGNFFFSGTDFVRIRASSCFLSANPKSISCGAVPSLKFYLFSSRFLFFRCSYSKFKYDTVNIIPTLLCAVKQAAAYIDAIGGRLD